MNPATRKITLAVVLVLIVGSIFYLQSRKVEQPTGQAENTEIAVSGDVSAEKANTYERAHEISTPDGFINVDDISIMGELEKGNVVLVDFWTYSCINCQRTIPYLRSWYEKYSDKGLTIIGVHTPEFAFEEKLENVQQAVKKFNIPYPVVLDNDYSTWQSYNNHYWPHKYLIDIDGYVVYDHIGEGGYGETEAHIIELLKERAERRGEAFDMTADSGPADVDTVDFGSIQTPEMYFGHNRLEHISNLTSTDCFDNTCSFTLPQSTPRNSFALGGMWLIDAEKATLTSETGTILLDFSAGKVNLVAEAADGATITVLLDGKPVGSLAGTDVVDGRVSIHDATLYNLVDLQGDYGEHTIELQIEGGSLSAFTFTFG